MRLGPLAALATVAAAIAYYAGASPPVLFLAAACALAALASLIGSATGQLGQRFGPGATGVLQSAIGNLPEFFVAIFALRAGLVTVVQTALIGSILVNSLLVLGLAFLVGGLKHGPQRFEQRQPRMIATLMLLAISALIVPTLASVLHTPAAGFEDRLGLASALVLLVVFLASIRVSLSDDAAPPVEGGESGRAWPLGTTIGVLVGAGLAAAFVSDWFVDALTPTIRLLGISDAFAGLVLVAIAGNAVENVVGIQLAAANKADYAVSVILNSSLQVALALIPLLVLSSFFVAPTPLTLVMPPLLVTAVFLASLLNAVIVFDGESTWLEGLALIGLYGIVAASFWWG